MHSTNLAGLMIQRCHCLQFASNLCEEDVMIKTLYIGMAPTIYKNNFVEFSNW